MITGRVLLKAVNAFAVLSSATTVADKAMAYSGGASGASSLPTPTEKETYHITLRGSVYGAKDINAALIDHGLI